MRQFQLVSVVAVLFSLLLLDSAWTQGTEPRLAGFGYFFIEPPRYKNGDVDPMNLVRYITKQFGPLGLKYNTPTKLTDRKVLNATLICLLRHTGAETLSNSVGLDCRDLAGRIAFSFSGAGTGMTLKGDLEAAIRKIADQVKQVRPRFDPAATVDFMDSLSSEDRLDVSELEIDKMIEAGRLRAAIEGVWTDAEQYKFAVLSTERSGEFRAVILESLSTRVNFWHPGMVKARLTQTADGQILAMRWKDALMRDVNGIAELQGDARLQVTLTLASGEVQKTTYLKLKPMLTSKTTATNASPNGARIPIGTGTAFFVAPGFVATNYHVIKDGSSFEISSPEGSLALEVVLSDPANDLAVLKVVGETRSPSLSLSTSDAVLGAETVVIGFPMGSTLGDGHKVTTGVVSSTEGLNGDPRSFQLTAPIQPGSSGSPVLSKDGSVIGIVVSTLDSLEAARRTGAIPQNVNFALKADYLALLIKRLPVKSPPIPTLAAAEQTTQLIQRAQKSIMKVTVYK